MYTHLDGWRFKIEAVPVPTTTTAHFPTIEERSALHGTPCNDPGATLENQLIHGAVSIRQSVTLYCWGLRWRVINSRNGACAGAEPATLILPNGNRINVVRFYLGTPGGPVVDTLPAGTIYCGVNIADQYNINLYPFTDPATIRLWMESDARMLTQAV